MGNLYIYHLQTQDLKSDFYRKYDLKMGFLALGNPLREYLMSRNQDVSKSYYVSSFYKINSDLIEKKHKIRQLTGPRKTCEKHVSRMFYHKHVLS